MGAVSKKQVGECPLESAMVRGRGETAECGVCVWRAGRWPKVGSPSRRVVGEQEVAARAAWHRPRGGEEVLVSASEEGGG